MCLLLWGTRYVHQGFTRAFGITLRNIIHGGTGNRFYAFASGLTVTALLQSSTATILLLTSFAKKNMVNLTAALAVILGADISTTLVAQILTFKATALSPAFLVIGVIGYKLYDQQNGRFKHIARVFIGLGFMLLSLNLIREISEPIKNSHILPIILEPLQNDYALAILIAALLTWLMHSSLAAVLLFASLTGSGIISLELGLLLVLGANIGGAIVPFAITFKEGPAAKRITFGNIIMRLSVLSMALPLLPEIQTHLLTLPGDRARHLVHFHTGFNIAVAIIFLPLIQWVAELNKVIFPPERQQTDGPRTLYLDEKALDTPVVALAGAARETLRMAEIVESMLRKTMKALEKKDNQIVKDIRRADNRVDMLYSEIKNYMSRLSQQPLETGEADRQMQILTFSTNLEHIGDIIEKSLLPLIEKKDRKEKEFSEQGFQEIQDFHKNVLDNMRLAQTIFISEDSKLAAQLVAKKEDIRIAANETSQKHFKRLTEGVPQTLATSSLHLDIIRDYRRINSYATRVAYTILEKNKLEETKKDFA